MVIKLNVKIGIRKVRSLQVAVGYIFIERTKAITLRTNLFGNKFNIKCEKRLNYQQISKYKLRTSLN